MKRLNHLFLLSGLVITPFALGQTQDMPVVMAAPSAQSQVGGIVRSEEPGVVVHTGGDMGFQFVAAEPAVSALAVKGAPYSLEATVETEQTLADGNRIVHQQEMRLYRDSVGRTRREETLAAIGPWAASGTPPTIVTIQDPVAKVTYSLDSQNKIATKLPADWPGKIITSRGVHTNGGGIINSVSTEGPRTTVGVAGVVVFQEGMASPVRPDEASEPLGKETFAGVSTEGVRTTITIPAESMGNERSIEITRERWFSPELQIVLRSKQSDPRFGVTTYEVTKLDRANPAHSLFEVPSDYKIRNAPMPPPPPAPPN